MSQMPKYPTISQVEECWRRSPEMMTWFNAEIRRLETVVAVREATIQMAVDRLGGMVERRPTIALNFLQRIDELRRIEDAGLSG